MSRRARDRRDKRAEAALLDGAELIEWNDVPGDTLPDDDTSVLLELQGTGEPTWPGYLAGDHWVDASTGEDITPHVTGWAHMPAGRRSRGDDA